MIAPTVNIINSPNITTSEWEFELQYARSISTIQTFESKLKSIKRFWKKFKQEENSLMEALLEHNNYNYYNNNSCASI